MTLPDSCSDISRALGEPLEGSAPSERFVLAVEIAEGWDRDPAKPLAARLPGTRVLAVRRAIARYSPTRRRAWLACVQPGRRFLERIEFDDEEELLELDLTCGEPTGKGFLHDEQAFLCCTHGKRDPCCVRHGLPLHRAVSAHAVARTWHSSHLGGHRFAATMAILPLGVWLGRVPPGRAREVVAAADAGRVPAGLLRGRAGLPGSAQAADAWLRRAEDIEAVDDVEVVDVEGETVRLRSGGGDHELRVTLEPTGTERPVSCGEGAKVEDPGRWVVRPVRRPG